MLVGVTTPRPQWRAMLTRHKLYKNSVVVLFDSQKHKYTYQNEVVPSVTTILSIINKPALVAWSANTAVASVAEAIEPGKSYDEIELQRIFESAKKAHTRQKVDAGNIGTFIHEWIEKYIHNERPKMPVNPSLREAVEQFLDWKNTNKVEFILSEQVVFSKKYSYIGTLDFICTIDGKPYIGDTKTSNAIYPEYFLQTSAYRQAREEEFPNEKYCGQVIVRVGKSGDFETKTLNKKADHVDNLSTFLHARDLYLRMERLKTSIYIA